MTLRDFFTKEIYTNIENAQGLMFNRFDRQPFSDFQAIEDIRTVNHFIIYNENQIVLSSSLPISFLNEVKKEASIQKNISQRYSGKVNNEKIFYVITKGSH